jgi:hypothetical protein
MLTASGSQNGANTKIRNRLIMIPLLQDLLKVFAQGYGRCARCFLGERSLADIGKASAPSNRIAAGDFRFTLRSGSRSRSRPTVSVQRLEAPVEHNHSAEIQREKYKETKPSSRKRPRPPDAVAKYGIARMIRTVPSQPQPMPRRISR